MQKQLLGRDFIQISYLCVQFSKYMPDNNEYKRGIISVALHETQFPLESYT